MEVAIVVFRQDEEVAVLSQHVDKQGIWGLELVVKCAIVDLHSRAAGHIALRDGSVFLVEPQIVEDEEEVVAGKRRTVRPSDPRAKL